MLCRELIDYVKMLLDLELKTVSKKRVLSPYAFQSNRSWKHTQESHLVRTLQRASWLHYSLLELSETWQQTPFAKHHRSPVAAWH